MRFWRSGIAERDGVDDVDDDSEAVEAVARDVGELGDAGALRDGAGDVGGAGLARKGECEDGEICGEIGGCSAAGAGASANRLGAAFDGTLSTNSGTLSVTVSAEGSGTTVASTALR